MSNNIQHPKVVVIGAGSLFFGRQAIWQMVHSPHLNNGTLALVDIEGKVLDKMVKLAKMVAAGNGVKLKVEGSTDRKDVLKGADYVVLSFARDSVRYRGLDCQISAKYGVRMCSGDTIGPGGIFRAMRELPVIMECAEDVRKLCPDAWVMNYINPSAVNGIALSRYAPDVKSFALCDGLHMPHIKKRYAVRAGIISKTAEFTPETDAEFDFRIAGVNHFTWILKAAYKGKDVMQEIAEALRKDAAKETSGGDTGAKAVYNSAIGYELYRIFGYVPACLGHTKEYMPYWQGKNVVAEEIPPLSLWETEARYERHREMWKQVDGFISGVIPIADYTKLLGPDHATDIIENIEGGLGKSFHINTMNNGAVTNMRNDSFLELLCKVDKNGPKPHPVGEMPRGLRGLQEQVLDTHELTVEAIMEHSMDKLRRAMLTDPIVNVIGDADAIMKELFEAERDILPAYWYK